VRDYEREGTEWLDRFLAMPANQAPTAARAKALQGAAELFTLLPTHDQDRHHRLVEECLAVCQAIGDRAGIALAMVMLGRSPRADERQAEVHLAQALALTQEVGATWVAAQATEGLGMVAGRRDDLPTAQRRYEESLELSRQLGDKRAVLWSAILAGVTAAALGDYARARERLAEALALGRELRSKGRIALALLDLASVARLDGDAPSAHQLVDEALALSRDVGTRWLTEWGELCRAWLALSEGDQAGARARAREALRLFREGEEHYARNGAVYLRACGVLAIEGGAVRHGARLLGAGDALGGFDRFYMRLLDDRDAYHRGVARAQGALGEDDYARAYAEGRALPLDQAVAYALGSDSEA
jgi:tetratricopeptide (TPR) repeat protein